MESELRCPMACGILPAQGLNTCPLHLQVASYPLTASPGKSSKGFITSKGDDCGIQNKICVSTPAFTFIHGAVMHSGWCV